MPPVLNEPLSIDKIKQTVEYCNSLALLQESGFLQFLQKFDGYEKEFALQFARSFKNDRVKIGPLKFKITKEFIVAAMSLDNTREKWFKN